jgi:hypothetical protein
MAASCTWAPSVLLLSSAPAWMAACNVRARVVGSCREAGLGHIYDGMAPCSDLAMAAGGSGRGVQRRPCGQHTLALIDCEVHRAVWDDHC